MTNLILYNGTFYTLDAAYPIVSALAIRAGKIVYAGDDATARSYAGTGWEAVDVKGACGVPGLVDAHLHLSHLGLALQIVNAETPSRQACLDAVAAKVAQTPKGEWVRGWGFNHNEWGGEVPTAAWLDSVAPDHPVAISSKSGHALWCNSLALQLCGITAQTPDPAGGEIVRDAAGKATGMLYENAEALVMAKLPEPTADDHVTAVRDAVAACARTGLTGAHDMDRVPAYKAEQWLDQRGELGIRIWKAIAYDQLDDAIGVGIMSGLGNDMLRISHCKMFTDGALGQQTAWMLSGYETAPDNCGIPTEPIEAIREAVLKANAHGLGAAIHAIGDRASREVLDLYEEVSKRSASRFGGVGLRNRIEHAQNLSPQDVARFGKLGVIPSMQPIHCTSDMHISDRFLGPERAKGAFPFRTLLETGAVLAFGSDAPVEVCDPLVGIHAAVTRRRADGSPGPEGWYPDQRLTVEQAVRGFSYGAAYAVGQEHKLGSLSEGKLGDVSLFSENIFEVDPHAIKDVSVVGTVVGGKFAYRSESI